MAQGVDIRQTTGRLQFRALLLDSAGAVVTSGTTNLRLYELQDGGTLFSYDWNDNTFKSGALTTENQAMTHRQGNNNTTNTGLWTFDLTTLTDFNTGGIYFAWVTNSGASPVVQAREFQFGNAEGDCTVTASLLNVDIKAINADTNADNRLAAALTTSNGIDLNMGQLTPVSPTADTTGEALRFAHQDLPNQIAPGASGGLPTTDANNRIAGIVGTRYNTLDQIGTTMLVSTTVSSATSTSVFRLTTVLGTDADDDFNGLALVIRDVSDSNRVYVARISDYTASTNEVTLATALPFTPASGDLVEIHAGGDASIATDLLKLTTGFGTASPNTLRATLLAMSSKTAPVPSGFGTYDPATDALEALGEGVVAMEGAGFTTSTDSLHAIRDAIDTLIAPAIVVSTSLSGSGFISDCISMVRQAVDEPSTNPKYSNSDILRFIQTAFDVVITDVNTNTDHPILVRHVITIEADRQNYTLPPNVSEVWRVAKVNSSSGLVEWEVWPSTEFSGHGRGFSIEGNTLRLLSKWTPHDTETLEILYVPSSEVTFHKATASSVTANTVVFPASVTEGTLDTRKNAYAGYVLRILSSTSPNRVEEKLITAYNNVTRTATLSDNFDTTPSGTIVYEVVPNFTRLMVHVVCLKAALAILAQEGNSKRMQTQGQELTVKMAALRRQLAAKIARFPHGPNGDTMDNRDRQYFGDSWLL